MARTESLAELKAICQQRSLPVTGVRDDLVKRVDDTQVLICHLAGIGQWDGVLEMLEQDPTLCVAKHSKQHKDPLLRGFSLLHFVARLGNEPLLQDLLALYPPVRAQACSKAGSRKLSAKEVAEEAGYHECAALLTTVANAHNNSTEGARLLMEAAGEAKWQDVEQVLSKDTSLATTRSFTAGYTVLHQLAWFGHEADARRLLCLFPGLGKCLTMKTNPQGCETPLQVAQRRHKLFNDPKREEYNPSQAEQCLGTAQYLERAEKTLARSKGLVDKKKRKADTPPPTDE